MSDAPSNLPPRDAPSPVSETAERDFDGYKARLERHTLMAALATRFISIPADSIDAAVEDAMAAIGAFAQVDRVALALFDQSGERWSIDHDWHSEGLWPLKGLVEHVRPFRWGLSQIAAGTAVEVLCPEDLPAAASNDSLLLRGLGLASALLIPVNDGERVIGFASLASTKARDKPWPKGFRELLELPARMVLHALERRSTEDRLHESQARWDSICGSNVVGVLSVRQSDGRLMECNEAALSLMGRERAELEGDGLHWAKITPPEEQASDRRMLAIAERTGRALPWNRQAMLPDGTRIPILCSLTSLAPQSDEILAATIDLRSRQSLAEELKHRDQIDKLHVDLSRRLLSLAGEAIDTAVQDALRDVVEKFGFDAVLVCDVDTKTWIASRRSWWSLPGPTAQEPDIRINLNSHSWWRDRLRAGRTTSIAGLSTLPESARAERASAERFKWESSVSVPLMPGGTLRGLILFYSAKHIQVPDNSLSTLRVLGDIVANAFERLRIDREISKDLAALERRIDRRVSQLERSNAELEAFAYSVSHDLRAPLRTVDGMCCVLREDFTEHLTKETTELLSRIQAATRRMAHLIDGLLQLSRVVRTPMKWEKIRGDYIFEGLVEEARRHYPDRAVEVHLPADVSLVGHPQLLRLAFEQLLDNAFKFTAPRALATITLETEQSAKHTVIRLRDNGVGFPAEFAPKLFSAFQRLHSPEEFEGHGIGLAIVERVVRMHGGRAVAHANSEGGACIELVLPLPEKTS